MFILGIAIGALSQYLFISKPQEIEYVEKAKELEEKYKFTLRAFAIQDSLLKLERSKRGNDITTRDSLSLAATSQVDVIDSLTRIEIDSNDLKEAILWLDFINK